MRVLHVQKVSGIGGSERHLLILLPALAARGIDVRMCVLATGDADRFVAGLDTFGIHSVVIPVGPDLDPGLVRRLLAEMRRYRPDLVHTHLVHADVYGQPAARLARVPAVSSVHGLPWFYRRQPYRAAGAVAGRLARRTIAISDHVATGVVELGLAPESRVRMVHYGMETDGWELSGDERGQARTDLGLLPGDVAIGVASRLVPHKGHATLVEAFRRAVKRPGPAAGALRLLVAGSGPLDADLRRQVAGTGLPAGTVRLLGFVPDIGRFMNACDVMVFPTDPEFGEGFGLAALEAMACARALVATDVGPLPELVVDGVTGVLVPPTDPDALADALGALAADPARRAAVGRRAADRAGQEFGVAKMVDGTLAVYAEAIGAGPLRAGGRAHGSGGPGHGAPAAP